VSNEIVPKKPKEESQGSARPRTIWAPDDFWEELKLAAKRERYSTSEFVLHLIKGGFAAYKKQRALEEKP
jgi:predicted CopG family antitoxin